MVTKIVLENFMSHSKTVIEPAPCLTVLTGPNNCGKSAIVAALQTICGNERGSFMVRHGQKESKVVVETSEGHVVEWRRKGSTVSYAINGREVHRGVPEDLHEVLRLPKVESREGKDEFDVHFGEQKRPIFLVGEPGSQAATFFASSSDAEYLVRMQSLHRQRTTERRAKERDLKAAISRLDTSLATLSPLDALAERMTAVEAMHAECVQRDAETEALAARLAELQRLTVEFEVTLASYRCLEALGEPPVQADTARLGTQVEETRSATASQARWQSEAARLERLSEPPEQADLPRLLSSIAEIRRATVAHAQATASHRALEPLTEAPTLHSDEELRLHLATLDRAQKDHRTLAQEADTLDRLTPAPDLADDAALAQTLSDLASATEEARSVTAQFGILEGLPTTPEQADEAELVLSIREVWAATQALDITRQRAAKLEAIPLPPEPMDLSSAVAVRSALAEAKAAFDLAARAMLEIQEATQAVRTEIEIWVALNPTCPVCGGDFDSNRILGEPEVAVG